ncbi:MAG TPA: rhomboid family intramembrane serine protease [Candidatus Limnocylindria bacterium]|nr:rhomboid family intramembrane serine protease [Candidatus Limnocylindria bacterium]
MIPLHDLNPTRRVPIVTRLLLFINIAVWLYVLSLMRTPGALEAFYDRYSFDWSAFGSALSSGRLTVDALLPLITHQFLHGGWLHVLGNMLYLWIFGDNVEDRIGSLPFLGFYLLCGVIAAIGQGLVAPAPMVGASGAIAGVLGAYLVMFPTARISTLVFLGIFITVTDLPALIVIGMFVVLQVIEGIAELRLGTHVATVNVAYFAHVFGFLAGILLLPLFRRGTGSRRLRAGWD